MVPDTVFAVPDFLLLDHGAGGSGERFDWPLILGDGSGGGFGFPYFLAGGINDNTILEALALRPYGIDVSSGAETDGVKDRDKIIRLVELTRQYGNAIAREVEGE
jgi:phosphoribosylanthranilate isomerase